MNYHYPNFLAICAAHVLVTAGASLAAPEDQNVE